ncbi:hypothetical protein [Candidatus Nanohalococcus occultus]|uniref:hypothetical protein n=1 Tax=Candidatus Nanohalococcus occultus TaxID=2978047 RepID=UPI0039DF9200
MSKVLAALITSLALIASGAAVSAANGAATPSSVDAGQEVSNQEFTFDLSSLSADGNEDTIYLQFSDNVAGELSANGVSSTVTVSETVSVVDGPDGDGKKDALRFALNPTGGSTVSPTGITVDTAVNYPDSNTTVYTSLYAHDSNTSDYVDSLTTITVASGGDGNGSATTTYGNIYNVEDKQISEGENLTAFTARYLDQLKVNASNATDLTVKGYNSTEKVNTKTYSASSGSNTFDLSTINDWDASTFQIEASGNTTLNSLNVSGISSDSVVSTAAPGTGGFFNGFLNFNLGLGNPIDGVASFVDGIFTEITDFIGL